MESLRDLEHPEDPGATFVLYLTITANSNLSHLFEQVPRPKHVLGSDGGKKST